MCSRSQAAPYLSAVDVELSYALPAPTSAFAIAWSSKASATRMLEPNVFLALNILSSCGQSVSQYISPEACSCNCTIKLQNKPAQLCTQVNTCCEHIPVLFAASMVFVICYS